MNIYNYFDKIYCINLDISIDRKEYVSNIFKELNIPVEFYNIKKHENGGLYGCFDSHINIIKYAYENNLENILVFEDDIEPTKSYNIENINKIINFMKKNKEYDIFYLGYLAFKDNSKNKSFSSIFNSKKIENNIYKYNPICTHSICYNRRSYKKILENYDDYIGLIHYDNYIANYLDLNNYCFMPCLFEQKYFKSLNKPLNNTEIIIRYIYNNLYQFHINYIISYIIFNFFKMLHKS